MTYHAIAVGGSPQVLAIALCEKCLGALPPLERITFAGFAECGSCGESPADWYGVKLAEVTS